MSLDRSETLIKRVVQLCTGLETTGTRVHRDLVWNLEESETPGLLIDMGEEIAVGETAQAATGFIDQELDIIISPQVVTVDGSITSVLNKIRKEIHVALYADVTLGFSWVHKIYYVGRTKPTLTGEGQKPIATQDITYRIHYRHSYADPSQ